jgi:hypothetical protein
MGIRDLKLSSFSRFFHWALANKLVIVLVLMISLVLLLLFRPGFRPEEFSAPATGLFNLCRNNNSNNDNKNNNNNSSSESTTDEEEKTLMSGDKDGGMMDVLLSALETDRNSAQSELFFRLLLKNTVRRVQLAAYPNFLAASSEADIAQILNRLVLLYLW